MQVHQLDAASTVRAVATGEIPPDQPTEASFERIGELDKQLNSFVETRAVSLQEASSASGPLAGLPVGVKDIFADDNRVPTQGSKVGATWVSGTAEVLQRLRGAGATVVGYTNLHEWSGMTSVITATGPIRNPWNTELAAGGSSGGSAAALAAGLVPAAIGNDAGGSNRVAAACCGVVGMIPTFGLVPLTGSTSEGGAIDTIGPMARTVPDARLLLEQMCGVELPSSPVASMRVGVATPFFFDDLAADVAAAVRGALDLIAGITAGVEEVVVEGADQAAPACGMLFLSHRAKLLQKDLTERPQDFNQQILGALMMGAAIPPEMVESSLQTLQTIQASWDRVFENVDVVVTPTLPVLPPCPVDTPMVPLPSGENVADIVYMQRTAVMSAGHVPCISMPCGETAEGWPVSLMVTGRRGGDAEVLSVAEALESALDGRYANRIAPAYS